jgi:hypothetical protein
MRRIPRLILLVAVATLAFFAGATIAMLRGWGTREVSVEIENDSKGPLRSFTVQYRTCGVSGSIRGGEVQPGHSHAIRYVVCGEGAYLIEAQLADGKVVRSREKYVVSRSSSTEIVTASGITSHQRLLSY